MKYTKTIISITSLLLLSACAPHQLSKEEGGFYHSGIYFGAHFPPLYQKGIKDGCKTAKGFYRKSHQAFNESNEYNNGWFLGRNRCRDLLVVEEE